MRFYYTLQKGQFHKSMADKPCLIPANLYYAKRGFVLPSIPDHLTQVMVDPGAFNLTQKGREYPYSLAEYACWLQQLSIEKAVMQDYVCFGRSVEDAHERTAAKAYQIWEHYSDMTWQWVPVLHGLKPDDYLDHVHLMRDLLQDMQARYGDKFVIGVGSLLSIQNIARRAKHIEAVLFALCKALPKAKFHGFGVSAGVIGRIYPMLESADSANWCPGGKQYPRQSNEDMHQRRAMGLTKVEYAFRVQLPRYEGKLHQALTQAPKSLSPEYYTAKLI